MTVMVNGVRYVVGTQRERIPVVQQGIALTERLATLKERYRQGYPYASKYFSNGYWRLVFSPSQGVSIGELVRHNYKEHQLLWISQLNDGSHLVVVCHGDDDIDEKHARVDDEDPLFWDSITAQISEYTLFLDGDVPRALEGFISEPVDLEPGKLLSSLAPFKGAELIPINEALKHTSSISITMVVLALAGFFAFCFIFFPGGTDDQEEIVDPYAAYRELFSVPSAASLLIDIEKIISGLQFVDGWELLDCRYAPSIQPALSCHFKPSLASGHQQLLRDRVKNIGRESTIDMAESGANVTFALQPQINKRPYLITPLAPVVEAQRSKILDLLLPDQLRIDQSTDLTYWQQQTITLGKSGTGLFALSIVAQSVQGNPTLLESMTIKRTGIGFDIEDLTLISIGALQ